MLRHLQEITYFAPDIDAYWDWLHGVLGAQVLSRQDQLIQGQIDGMRVTVHPSDEKGPNGPGGQVAYWAVIDIGVALAHFERHGGQRFRGPLKGVDEAWVAQVKDPWGNVWGLWQQSSA